MAARPQQAGKTYHDCYISAWKPLRITHWCSGAIKILLAAFRLLHGKHAAGICICWYLFIAALALCDGAQWSEVPVPQFVN